MSDRRGRDRGRGRSLGRGGAGESESGGRGRGRGRRGQGRGKQQRACFDCNEQRHQVCDCPHLGKRPSNKEQGGESAEKRNKESCGSQAKKEKAKGNSSLGNYFGEESDETYVAPLQRSVEVFLVLEPFERLWTQRMEYAHDCYITFAMYLNYNVVSSPYGSRYDRLCLQIKAFKCILMMANVLN
ncbi:hypothetical protein PHMEG_0005140 [Phytophthora megakarya]|uniref:Uncharacterized protein n=1 Tax=Phytophthora megakarya TaxID=4795 RepID=A0A225WTK5_9STRA|nr:hypothetical protein PHMEG_0005140 [Phytophthora megakarya]